MSLLHIAATFAALGAAVGIAAGFALHAWVRPDPVVDDTWAASRDALSRASYHGYQDGAAEQRALTREVAGR